MKRLILVCLLFFANIALSAPNFPPAQGYVNDFAHMLSPATSTQLNNQLRDFDKQTSDQVVVATFDSLNGQALEDFSIGLATQWKIGSKKHDNGVLLLIIKNDHKIRIEVGYGLEGALTDATSSSIIRNQIAPYFKQSNYDAGVQNGTNAILQAIKGEYTATPDSQESGNAMSWVIGVLVLAFFVYGFYKNGPLFLLFFFTGGGGGGRGGDDDEEGGGFSGGGGGFGGGGSSGGW